MAIRDNPALAREDVEAFDDEQRESSQLGSALLRDDRRTVENAGTVVCDKQHIGHCCQQSICGAPTIAIAVLPSRTSGFRPCISLVLGLKTQTYAVASVCQSMHQKRKSPR
jgi:hypothetical protein